MTIPRQIGPETGLRRILPDYSRSSATVERMIERLDGPGASSRGPVRVLLPANAMADTGIRAVIAALLLGGALVTAVIGVLALLTVEEGHAPGLGVLVLLLLLGGLALVQLLLGLRFAVVALGTARGRVEVDREGVLVVGALRSRRVAWKDVAGVESRVSGPVHWLTAALRLRDGSRVVMPAFDRHVWDWSRATAEDVRSLRRALHEHESAGKGTPWRP